MNSTARQTLIDLSERPSDEVFPPEGLRALDHHYKHACQKAGISGLRIHDLRHTFASRLVANGADLVTVKDLLGHSVILTTMRYAHSRAHQQAVDLLAKASDSQEAAQGESLPTGHKLVTNA